MKIAIEAQRIFRPHKHGMDFVVLEVIRELQQIDQENEYYILVAPGTDPCLSPSKNFQIIEIKCPFYPLWEQYALPHILRRLKPDIVHCTSNTAPLFCKYPLVLTLHDIIFMGKKKRGNNSWYQNFGWYYRRFIVPHIVHKCKKIITVSQNEYTNIQSKFSLGDKLITIHNGFSKQYKVIVDPYTTTQKYCPQQDYLLFLGNADPRKNTVGILKAYAKYLQMSESKRHLVISSITPEEAGLLLEKENIAWIKPNLHFTGYITGKDLPALYNGAFAFLFPSYSEGFGIPILEAMACGTPVVTSNCSSMPEVAGEGAILINPCQPEEITAALLRLEDDPSHYNAQVNYGLARASEFTWKETAQRTLQIYRNLKNESLCSTK